MRNVSLSLRIANDFIPTFSASKLGDLCGSVSESIKFRYLKQFKPFSHLILQSKCPQNQVNNFCLSKEERENIKKCLDDTLNYKDLTFNDNILIDTLKNKKAQENYINLLMNQFSLTGDKPENFSPAKSNQVSLINNKIENMLYLKSIQAHRYVCNMRGRKLEKHILEKLNREKQKNFVQKKTKKIVDFGKYKIVGVIDGISHEEKTILEIKTRSKFDMNKETITNKEKKQAITYMKMYDCNTCLFVENGPNGERKETIINYDENLFQKEIHVKLEEFCLYARCLTYVDFYYLIDKYLK